uniref:Na(+)/H(+) exchange regulatory cofactor NHE-RF n=1 Tax=Anas platyrhynchos TaxID=8839 RepID=A0A8B9TSJ8_ANAPL
MPPKSSASPRSQGCCRVGTAGRALKPRLCHMLKGENGYGFHLHGEKGKSGQFIRKVEPGSPAEAAGLRAGDRVVEVNGLNVEQETHHQVVQRIKAVETETRLLVVDKETDEYLCSLRLTCTEEMVHSGVLLGSGVSPTKMLGALPPAPFPPENCAAQPRQILKELCPRLCHLKKGPNGYGFNLHSEKSQPGQFIRSVDPDSPASRAGLRPQDRLVEVNGINVEGLRHSEVVSHIKARESEARLLVVDPETDDYFKKLGVTPTEEHTKGETRTRGESGVRCSEAVEEEPVRALAAGTSTKEPLFPAAGTWPGASRTPGCAGGCSSAGPWLSPRLPEAKEKVRAKRVKKRAPQMDWNKKREIFSNF